MDFNESKLQIASLSEATRISVSRTYCDQELFLEAGLEADLNLAAIIFFRGNRNEVSTYLKLASL